MRDRLPLFALTALVASGILTAALAAADPGLAWLLAGAPLAPQLFLVAVGAALVTAALVPAWRRLGMTVGLSGKASYLLLSPSLGEMTALALWADAAAWALLLFAVAVFAREAWREARWDRGLTLEA